MKTDKIISPELIFLDQEVTSKQALIQQIAAKAQAIGYLTDAVAFYDAVMAREAEVPTAIGYDIAIPHGKTDVVKQAFIAFYRTKAPFQWTTGMEEPAQLIFQIGVPETGTETLHLKFISQVSKRLLDEEFRDKLRTLSDAKQVLGLLNSIQL